MSASGNINWETYNLQTIYSTLISQPPIILTGLLGIASTYDGKTFYLIDNSGYVLIIKMIRYLNFIYSYSILPNFTSNPFTIQYNNCIKCTKDGRCVVCCYLVGNGNYNYYYSVDNGITFNNLTTINSSNFTLTSRGSECIIVIAYTNINSYFINIYSINIVSGIKKTSTEETKTTVGYVAFTDNNIYSFNYYPGESTNPVYCAAAYSFIVYEETKEPYKWVKVSPKIYVMSIGSSYCDSTGQYIISTSINNSGGNQLINNNSFINESTFSYPPFPDFQNSSTNVFINSTNSSYGNYLLISNGTEVMSSIFGPTTSSGSSAFITETYFSDVNICGLCTAGCDNSENSLAACIGGSNNITNLYFGDFYKYTNNAKYGETQGNINWKSVNLSDNFPNLTGLMGVCSNRNSDYYYILDFSGYIIVANKTNKLLPIYTFNEFLVATPSVIMPFSPSYINLIQCDPTGKYVICALPFNSYLYYYSTNRGQTFTQFTTSESPNFSLYYNETNYILYITIFNVGNQYLNIFELNTLNVDSEPTFVSKQWVSVYSNSCIGITSGAGSINVYNAYASYGDVIIPNEANLYNYSFTSDAVLYLSNSNVYIEMFPPYTDLTSQYNLILTKSTSNLVILYSSEYCQNLNYYKSPFTKNMNPSLQFINNSNGSLANYLIISNGLEVWTTISGPEHFIQENYFSTYNILNITAVCTSMCNSENYSTAACIGTGKYNDKKYTTFYYGEFINQNT